MKIKTASLSFGQINIGVTMNGTGGNHGSSKGQAQGACIAAPAGQEPAPWPWLCSMGELALPGGCREAHQPHQPPCVSPILLWGHPRSHHDAPPIREMGLETFPQWYGALQSCARGARGQTSAAIRSKAFPLSFRSTFHFPFS